MPALMTAVPPQNDLSPVEVKVLDFLAHTLRPGFCPSREELSKAAGIGHRGSSIRSTLRNLEAKGYLELSHDRSRRITLRRTADGRRCNAETMCSLVAGEIAGRDTPLTTRANVIGEAIELARSMLGGREDVLYAIRVRDHTLTDALVKPGDVVVLARAGGVANGELAAVRVSGQDGRKPTSLKYYYRENGHVRLQPAHPDMPPLYCKPDQVMVQGRVVLIVRQFA